jgi:hypothetical protein
MCQEIRNDTGSPPEAVSVDGPRPEARGAKEGSERIVGILPAFNVSEQRNPAPLSSKEKFMLFARTSYDPVTLLAPLIQVPILQAVDNSNDFGTGFRGFAYRYGVSVADSTSCRFFRTFLFPAILKEDPRYFRKSQGSFRSRLGYSLSRLFVTRSDAGKSAFNWSRLLAGGAAAGLGNTYYPESQRDTGGVLLRFGLSYGAEAGANFLKEFAPEIARKFKSKKVAIGQSPPRHE